MGDTQVQTDATNGTAAPRTNGARAPRPSKAEVLADLNRFAQGGEVEDKPAPVEAKEKPAPVETDVDAEFDDSEGKERGEKPDEDLEAAKAKTKDEDKPDDAKTAKGLDKVARAEKRMREQIAKERESVKAERAELDGVRRQLENAATKVQEFEKFAARAKYDPVGALAALGVKEDDFEDIARQLYASSPAGQKDPKNHEAARRLAKQREESDVLAQVRKELAEVKSELKKRDEHAASERAMQQFMANTMKAAKTSVDDAPLVARLVEKNPEKAQRKLAQTAMQMIERDGDIPDPEDVVAEYEKARREELEDAGVDVDAMLKKPKAKATDAETDEERTERRSIGDVRTTTAPKGPKKTKEEIRAELMRDSNW